MDDETYDRYNRGFDDGYNAGHDDGYDEGIKAERMSVEQDKKPTESDIKKPIIYNGIKKKRVLLNMLDKFDNDALISFCMKEVNGSPTQFLVDEMKKTTKEPELDPRKSPCCGVYMDIDKIDGQNYCPFCGKYIQIKKSNSDPATHRECDGCGDVLPLHRVRPIDSINVPKKYIGPVEWIPGGYYCYECVPENYNVPEELDPIREVWERINSGRLLNDEEILELRYAMTKAIEKYAHQHGWDADKKKEG